LAQRRGPHHAWFWRDGVKAFTAATAGSFFRSALQFAEKRWFLNEWEGHEFTRAVKSLKNGPRFSARGTLFPLSISFQQAV
jgi:hypothetical protein